MPSAMEIPYTLEIITQCWDKAETALRRAVKKKYRDPNEETITWLFCREFSFLLRRASEQGLIEKEFLKDLRRAYPELRDRTELRLISENLIADVSLHKRHIEKDTGGDFGLTITRPDVSFEPPSYSYHGTGSIETTYIYQRGLLCQAKLKHKSNWGELTDKQKSVLPKRLEYLGLLLYECGGEERQLLRKFAWQLCTGKRIKNITEWLKSGNFPSLSSSSEIIQKLGIGEIGTDDKQTLEKIIRPTGKPQFSIRIDWGSNPPPPPSISIEIHSSLSHRVETEQKNLIYIRRGG
jgi:hypothetical protein